MHVVVFLFAYVCVCVCAGTVRRSLWSCQKMSVMSWWRKRAAVCSRLGTVSATLHARRRPLRSTWTAALRKTRDKTDGLEHISRLFFFVFWHLLAAAAQKPGHATLNLSVKPDRYLNIRQHCEADVPSPSNLSPWTGSETLLCTIVYVL